MMELAEVIELQKENALGDLHVVHVGPERFSLAHTDKERRAGHDLRGCPVHQWLEQLSGPPAKPGVYVVTTPGTLYTVAEATGWE